MNLIKKNCKFDWNTKCKHTFNDLKKQFMIALIFVHFNFNFECVFKADLSDHAQEDVFLQYDKNDMLCSVVYFSWKLNIVKSNYKIYDKKLLAIIQCFKQWWLEFKKSVFLIKMLIDYKNLQYFMIIK